MAATDPDSGGPIEQLKAYFDTVSRYNFLLHVFGLNFFLSLYFPVMFNVYDMIIAQCISPTYLGHRRNEPGRSPQQSFPG